MSMSDGHGMNMNTGPSTGPGVQDFRQGWLPLSARFWDYVEGRVSV